MGLIGAIGPAGAAGLVGAIGSQGLQGLVGAIGEQGVAGLAGAIGPAGVAGLVGAIGPQGLQGLVGAIGEQGVAGLAGAIGPAGIAGLQGLIGPQGIQGLVGEIGIPGIAGMVGPQGVAGLIGPIGATGATGPAGPPGSTGATGPAGQVSTSYAYIYNSTSEIVALQDDVDFDSNGVMTAGIAHAPGSPTITIQTAGVYEITYSATTAQRSQFALVLNGAVVPQSIYGSYANAQQNEGQVVLTVPANSTLSLRNHTSSSGPVTLQSLAGGIALNVNASILIRRLS